MEQTRRKPQIIEFITTEAGGGVILAIAAFIAIIWANSPLAASYFGFIDHPIRIQVGDWSYEKTVLKWVKEGLMAIFFFVVGLEIKYEIFRGELSSLRKLALPVIAAFGGMAVPALVYVGINMFAGGDMRGWAVPAATDIAFALAVLALVGKGLPSSLRIFLLTLAIVDDLGAVMIIGIFFNNAFVPYYIAVVAVLLVLMFLARYIVTFHKNGVGPAYTVLFVAIWAMSLHAGLSTSLTAVLAAFMVTIDPAGKGEEGMLKSIIHDLHPYVAYMILPLFAFVAAGFSFAGMGWEALSDLRFLGVAAGLFVGKQLGIFAVTWLAVKVGLGRKPEGSTFAQIYGVCLLCGIGFTMSLYIGALAFPVEDVSAHNAVKLGVIVGSILSACAGAILLMRNQTKAHASA